MFATYLTAFFFNNSYLGQPRWRLAGVKATSQRALGSNGEIWAVRAASDGLLSEKWR